MNKRKTPLQKGEIIPISFDYVFTGIFNNEENIDIIENFLSIYFDIDINKIKGHVKLLSRDLPIDTKQESDKQVDLVLDINHKKINIELNKKYEGGIIDRNIVFASKVHSRQLQYAFQKYSDIEQTIQINLNENSCHEYGVRKTYYLKNEEGQVLSEKLRIDVVDMQNANKMCYTSEEEKLARWCRVITSKTEEELRRNLGDDLMEEKTKDKLEKEVDKYSTDDEAICLYTKLSKAELEHNTLIYDAEQKGIKEGLERGIEQGIEQNKLEIAKKMLEENENIEKIMLYTSLSKEQIDSLKNSN
jgi:predicted transposase/invertase (TIGR01784 family)